MLLDANEPSERFTVQRSRLKQLLTFTRNETEKNNDNVGPTQRGRET